MYIRVGRNPQAAAIGLSALVHIIRTDSPRTSSTRTWWLGESWPNTPSSTSRIKTNHNSQSIHSFIHSSPSSSPHKIIQGTNIQTTPIPLSTLIDIIRTNAFRASADTSGSGSRRWGRDPRRLRLSKHSSQAQAHHPYV